MILGSGGQNIRKEGFSYVAKVDNQTPLYHLPLPGFYMYYGNRNLPLKLQEQRTFKTKAYSQVLSVRHLYFLLYPTSTDLTLNTTRSKNNLLIFSLISEKLEIKSVSEQRDGQKTEEHQGKKIPSEPIVSCCKENSGTRWDSGSQPS